MTSAATATRTARDQRRTVRPTGQERLLAPDDLIVSKTDLRGVITYANESFLRFSAYAEEEVIGRPHNLIRHPAMPRAVFRLLWDTLARGEEVFAYIDNLAADGATYWVLANVTPSYDAAGQVVGYHSSRRAPSPVALPRSARCTSGWSPRSGGTPRARRPPRPAPPCSPRCSPSRASPTTSSSGR